jgi:hypothetical protein
MIPLSPLKGYLMAGAGVAFLVLVILLQGAWGARDQAERERDAAKAQAVVAETQGGLNQSAAEAVQVAQTRELSITLNAERQADAVAAAPGGDALLSDGVLAAWRSGIQSMREPTQ